MLFFSKNTPAKFSIVITLSEGRNICGSGGLTTRSHVCMEGLEFTLCASPNHARQAPFRVPLVHWHLGVPRSVLLHAQTRGGHLEKVILSGAFVIL
jgi:hypothetical protein